MPRVPAQSDMRSFLQSSRLSRRSLIRYAGIIGSIGPIASIVAACGGKGMMASTKAPEASGSVEAGSSATAASASSSAADVAGKQVHELVVTYQSSVSWMTDMWRRVALDGQKLGLKYNLNGVSTSAWLNAFYQHTFGDLLSHANDSRDYRDSDPTEQVVARLVSSEATPPLRNIGEYKNPEVDRLADIVNTELDPDKRRDASNKIQEIVARDYYIWSPCTGPDPINAYNSGDWENVTSTPGNSVAGQTYVWNWETVKPKGDLKRVNYAVNNLDKLALTNPFGPGGVRGPNQLYWDKLISLSPELKPIPWVLTEWKMVDNLTWNLTVRDGMKWHDGNPATAEDVAFTFNYIVKWKPSYYAVVSDAVDKAEVLDDKTVQVHTKQPAANMVTDLLIRTPLVPKHIWENVVESQGAKDPSAVDVTPDMIIGTGPFKFDHLTPDVELLVTANMDHWQPPNVDELLLLLVESLDSQLGKLENKEIDFENLFLTPSQADRLKGQSFITIDRQFRTLNPFIVPFFAKMPWRDPVFRRAWHRSVDKDYLVNVVWEGAGEALEFNSLMAKQHPFFDPNISEKFNFDLDEAKKILSDGGYTWDDDGRLVYPPASNSDFIQRSEKALVGDSTS